jgi:putative tryptophan/tyrosine transport system substrate-binding protein
VICSSRTKIVLLALAMIVATTAAAQNTKQPRKVGVMLGCATLDPHPWLQTFKDGMTARGWTENKNIQYFLEYAGNEAANLPALAAKLLSLKVDALFVSGGRPLAAMKKATTTVPIVCPDMWDHVAEGVSSSLTKPTANITGLTWQSVESATKRLEMAKEIVPGLTRLGVLFDASDPGPTIEVNGLVANAKTLGIRPMTYEVRCAQDFKTAFAAIKRDKPDALIVSFNPLTYTKIAELARFPISISRPLVTEGPEFAEGGALVSYGVVVIETYKRGAVHLDKILKGAKPSDLPIEQPTLFELVVNLKTAKTLGIKIPETIMVRPTKVIR